MKKLFLFSVCLFSVLPLLGQNIEGSWSGVLEAGPQKLRLNVTITKQDSSYTGTLASPDQNFKIPFSTVGFNSHDLSFEIKQLGASYKGAIQGDTLIAGTFTQSGMSFPLSLTREQIVINRPQEPKPPYPYKSENVTFSSKSADVTLAGTLTMPQQGAGKFPAVILVTGSGKQNRDEEVFDHKPFLVISDYLTRNGIAVLRYDDRGAGESTGNFATSTTGDFTEDALGAFDYLARRPEIDHGKIGILGHSEGGTIVFLAAAQQPKVAFVISLAGMAIKGDSLLVIQNRDVLLASGQPADMVEVYCTVLQKCFNVVNSQSNDYIVQNLEQIHSGVLAQNDGESLPKAAQENLAAVLTAVTKSPWMRYFLSLDPTPYIKATKCHVLAINGNKDLQVDAKVNLTAIERNLKAVGNSRYTIREYEGLNHLFQHSATGLVAEYGQIEETISPEVLKDITEWILKIK